MHHNYVTIYTDGSSKPHTTRAGGWGAVVMMDDWSYEIAGREHNTTNSRMEIMAIAESLRSLDEPSHVVVYSDSEYVVNSIAKGWVYGWQKRGWRKSDGNTPAHTDLWLIILALIEWHDEVVVRWIRGHDGNIYNERADALATQAAGGAS